MSKYVDFYLRAPDEATALFAATHAELPEGMGLVEEQDGEPQWIESGPGHAFDIVGVRYNNDAVLDAEGEVVTPATPMEGWWANLRVREDLADETEAALIAAEQVGIERVESTGRVFF